MAHSLICVSWWYGLKWILRGDLGTSSVLALAVLGALASALAWRLRTKKRVLPPSVSGTRIAATLLFVALFLTTAASEWPYWVHLLAVGVPYVLVTPWPRVRGAA